MLLGYARVSTGDQSLDSQEDQLRAAGCERIFSDKASGARTARPGLDALLTHARAGDVVVVWRLDRLGRSLAHLIETVEGLQQSGRGFRSLTESIDTTTPAGRLIFHIFASLAQFERELIRERVKAGVASARARGLTGGRPLALDEKAAKLARKLMADRSRNVNDIARTLGVSRSTLYRIARQDHEQWHPAATSPAQTPADAPGKPIRAGESTGKTSARGERAVSPQAVSVRGRKTASDPRKSTKTKTPTTPRKGKQVTTSKRKP